MADCLLLTGFHGLLTLGDLGESHHCAGEDLHCSDTRVQVYWLPVPHSLGQNYLIMTSYWFAFTLWVF